MIVADAVFLLFHDCCCRPDLSALLAAAAELRGQHALLCRSRKWVWPERVGVEAVPPRGYLPAHGPGEMCTDMH